MSGVSAITKGGKLLSLLSPLKSWCENFSLISSQGHLWSLWPSLQPQSWDQHHPLLHQTYPTKCPVSLFFSLFLIKQVAQGTQFYLCLWTIVGDTPFILHIMMWSVDQEMLTILRLFLGSMEKCLVFWLVSHGSFFPISLTQDIDTHVVKWIRSLPIYPIGCFQYVGIAGLDNFCNKCLEVTGYFFLLGWLEFLKTKRN